jgi:hypothetical protein
MEKNLRIGIFRVLPVSLLFILQLVLFQGCTQTTGMLGGAAIGTGAGAGVGYAIGGRGGAALGGVIGGLAGGAIGRQAANQSERDNREYVDNTRSAELEVSRQRRELERQRLELERERIELEKSRRLHN